MHLAFTQEDFLVHYLCLFRCCNVSADISAATSAPGLDKLTNMWSENRRSGDTPA